MIKAILLPVISASLVLATPSIAEPIEHQFTPYAQIDKTKANPQQSYKIVPHVDLKNGVFYFKTQSINQDQDKIFVGKNASILYFSLVDGNGKEVPFKVLSDANALKFDFNGNHPQTANATFNLMVKDKAEDDFKPYQQHYISRSGTIYFTIEGKEPNGTMNFNGVKGVDENSKFRAVADIRITTKI